MRVGSISSRLKSMYSWVCTCVCMCMRCSDHLEGEKRQYSEQLQSQRETQIKAVVRATQAEVGCMCVACLLVIM